MKLNKVFSYILLLLLLIPVSVFARDIYVAKTGSDTTGDGSIDNPYATPFYAMDNSTKIVQSGDTVIIREGHYHMSDEIDIRKVSDVIIKAFPGENVHISTPINYDGRTQLVPYTTFYIHPSSSNITLKDLEISGGSRYSVSFGSEWKWGTNAATGGTIDNCKIHDCGGDCIKVQPRCDNFTLINSEIYNTCAGAASAPDLATERSRDQNCQGFDSVQVDNILIKNNHFHDIRYRNDAIVPKGGGRNVVIERNLVENAFGGILVGGNTGPVYLDWDDNPTGYQLFDVVVRNNIVKNTKWHGIMVVDVKDAKIYNNTLIDVGNLAENDPLFETAPAMGSGDDYHGNIFWIKHMNNFRCDNLPDCTVTSPNNLPSKNILWVNNVGYKDSGKGPEADPYYNTAVNLDDVNQGGVFIKPVDLGTLSADHNIYYDPNYTDMRTRDETGWISGADTIHTFDDWRQSTAHSTTHGEQNSSFQDPRVDLVTGVPLPGSPALLAGVMVDGLTEDFYGNPRDPNKIDIGAIQVTASQTTCSANPAYCSIESQCTSAGWNWCSGGCQWANCPVDTQQRVFTLLDVTVGTTKE